MKTKMTIEELMKKLQDTVHLFKDQRNKYEEKYLKGDDEMINLGKAAAWECARHELQLILNKFKSK